MLIIINNDKRIKNQIEMSENYDYLNMKELIYH